MKKLFLVLLVAGLALPAVSQSANDLFQQALVLERTSGDLQAAITLYERVVSASSSRALAAQALVRIGQNYERLGLTRARETYARVVSDYGDQAESARIARTRLTALTPSEPVAEPPDIIRRHVHELYDSSGQVSPDGRYLSYVHWPTGDQGIQDLETGEITLIDDLSWEDGREAFGDVSYWSPDGRQLLYCWIDRDEGASSLRLYDMETMETRVLNAEGFFPLGWMPDGSGVLAVVEDDAHSVHGLYTIDAISGTPTLLRSTPREPAHSTYASASPDGRHIATALSIENDAGTFRSTIEISRLDGSHQHTVPNNGYGQPDPRFSADGRYLIYFDDRDETVGLWATAVEDGVPSGNPTRLVESVPGIHRSMGVTTDGSYYYASTRGESNVFVQGFDESSGTLLDNARIIFTNLERLAGGLISPDGSRLVTVVNHGWPPTWGPNQLVEIGLDDDRIIGEYKLALDPDIIRVATWVPDRNQVIVLYSKLGGDSGYQVVDLDTGESRVLLAHRPAPGRKGWTAFASNPATGEETTLASSDSLYFYHPGWLGGCDVSGRTAYCGIRQLLIATDLDTGDARLVHEVDATWIGSIAISPDGTRLAAMKDSDVVLVGLSDGQIRMPPVTFGDDEQIHSFWWSDDDHLVAHRRRGEVDDLVQITVDDGEVNALESLERYAAPGRRGGFRFYRGKNLVSYTLRNNWDDLWVIDGLNKGM